METAFPPAVPPPLAVPPVTVTAAQYDTPVIIALPHSGAHYPECLRASSRLSALSLRRSEDAYLDALLANVQALGIAVIATPFARAFVDVNRNPADIDPVLVGAPAQHRAVSERAAAGLGVVPRIVGAGIDIYRHALTPDIVQQRIAQVHVPYHQALSQLIARTSARHSYAVLLDVHSMPSGKVHGRPLANIVLGDRNGRSCAPMLSHCAEQSLEAQRLRVARNDPYAGGYTTEFYGAPHHGVHVLQIEIDRSLYMDEARMEPHSGFAGLQLALHSALTRIMAAVEAETLGLNAITAPPLAAE
jgi:N-formylglutamate amidohydrolase